MRPPAAVVGVRVVGQVVVHQADACRVPFGQQQDLHACGAGGDGVVGHVPPEGEDHPLVRRDVEELADRRVLAADEHPADAAGSRVEVGLGAHPLDLAHRVGEERPDGLRRRGDHDLSYQLAHRRAPVRRGRVGSASATRRSSSSPLVQ